VPCGGIFVVEALTAKVKPPVHFRPAVLLLKRPGPSAQRIQWSLIIEYINIYIICLTYNFKNVG
jgi:hypothetical protein